MKKYMPAEVAEALKGIKHEKPKYNLDIVVINNDPRTWLFFFNACHGAKRFIYVFFRCGGHIPVIYA